MRNKNIYKVNVIAFKGLSLVSKIVKFWTRSEYSHIGFLLEDKYHLVEAWVDSNDKLSSKFIIGSKWRLTTLDNHTVNTPIVILEKAVSKEQYEKLRCYLDFIIKEGVPYDWVEIFGFVIPFFKGRYNGKRVCSTGTIAYLKHAGILPEEIEAYKISPDIAVQILLANGFYISCKGRIVFDELTNRNTIIYEEC